MRDPKLYRDPEVFRPERFLEIDPDSDFETWDPRKIVFGFGRRSATIYLGAASTYSHFISECAQERSWQTTVSG